MFRLASLFLLCAGCFSSASPDSPPDEGWRGAPPICEERFLSRVPVSAPCEDPLLEPLRPDMLCRGEDAQVWAYSSLAPRLSGARCDVEAEGEALRLRARGEWCANSDETASRLEYLYGCAGDGLDGLEVVLDEEALELTRGTCSATSHNYLRCERDTIVADAQFTANDVCLLSGECGEARIRISGAQIPTPPGGQDVAHLFCESVRYEEGRLHVEVAPSLHRGCFGATTSDQPNADFRAARCPVPPNVPRAAIEVFVNARRVGTVDFREAPDCL